MPDYELLKLLCETPGVPGREDQLRTLLKEKLSALAEEVSVDALGNVIARRKAGTRKVMIAAHMDEIGFMVKFIGKDGFIRLQPLGGFDPRQLFAQRVIVHTRDGERLRGVLSYSTKPTHMLSPEEQGKPAKLEEFFVDVGLGEEDVRRKIALGDMVTMDRTFERCGSGFISKSLDNRVGVFVMLEALAAARTCDVDLYAVATVQEEVGLRGAGTAAFSIAPEVGIALDTTLANDFPGVPDQDAVTSLGKGVGIKIMDASLICHPKLVDHFRSIAVDRNIPHQMEVLPRGGTDAGALQRSREGSASITLSVPTRYIHTVNEMVSASDVESAVLLLAAYIEKAHEGDYRL